MFERGPHLYTALEGEWGGDVLSLQEQHNLPKDRNYVKQQDLLPAQSLQTVWVMLQGVSEKITGRGGPWVHFVNELLTGGCGVYSAPQCARSTRRALGTSSRGNRSLLEAIAFPTVRENIMHGRLGGYYFNTFLLAAEQGGCVLGQARRVTPCSLRSSHRQAGLAQRVQNPSQSPHCDCAAEPG